MRNKRAVRKVIFMYVTWELIISICAGFSAICLSVGYLIKIYRELKKPKEHMDGKIDANTSEIAANKTKLGEQEDEMAKVKKTLDYLVNANNLVIRSLFTVLGELSINNDVNGHCAKAQDEIQKFLTPVK